MSRPPAAKPPVKPPVKPQERPREKPQKPQDFSDEYQGKRVKIKLGNGEVLEGTFLRSSKYFIKLAKPEGGIVVVNKAWVAVIEPRD